MKIQITKSEGLTLNHNLGGLKVKPQKVAIGYFTHVTHKVRKRV